MQDEPEIESRIPATADAETFGRLLALVDKGYAPNFEMSDDRFLVLIHPQKRFKYRHILLASSGAVRWLHDDDYKMHFSRWEKKRFDGFLRSVPQPTSWDRTRPYCERIGAAVLGAIVCYVLYVIVWAAMSFAHGYFGWG